VKTLIDQKTNLEVLYTVAAAEVVCSWLRWQRKPKTTKNLHNRLQLFVLF